MKLNLVLLTAGALAAFSFKAQAQVITQVIGQANFDADLTATPYVDDFENTSAAPANGYPGFYQYFHYTDAAGSIYDSESTSADAGDGPTVYQFNAAVNEASDGGKSLIGAGDGSYFIIGDGRGTVTFTAASGITAIGADFFDAGTTGAVFPMEVTVALIADPTVTISESFDLDVPPATGSADTTLTYFAGFIAPEGYEISTLVSAPNENPGIDNLTAGTAAYPVAFVPEPASLGLLLVGSLFLVGWMRLRARRSQTIFQ